VSDYRLELRPTGPGPAFRERLAAGIERVAGDARLSVVGVVVDLQPINDSRPDGVKLRRALKQLLRQAGLQARWHAEAKRRTATPAPKQKARKRAGKAAAEPGPDATG
jgi:hypothetical protein